MSWVGFCFSNGIGDAIDDIYVPLEFLVDMQSNSLGLTAEEIDGPHTSSNEQPVRFA